MQLTTTNSENALAMQMSALALSRQNLAISREQRDSKVTERLQALDTLLKDVMDVQHRLKTDLAGARSQLDEQEITFTAEKNALALQKNTLQECVDRLKSEILELQQKNGGYSQRLAALQATVHRFNAGPGATIPEDWIL